MSYDLIIIGSGWAGFNASKVASAAGKKVLLIEKDSIGGTCLNYGCIPTKALIQSAKIYSQVKKAQLFGIETGISQVNLLEIQKRKDLLIEQLKLGLTSLLKNITVIKAEAEIVDKNTVCVEGKNINTEYILICSGSSPLEIKGLEFDHKKIISSDDILNIKEIPKSLLIVGGGVIGCEFASCFNIFGTEVTIVEKLPQLLPGIDKDISRKLETSFRKRKINVLTATDSSSININDFDLVLVCVGRSPNVNVRGLEKTGVKFSQKGIIIDEYLRTSIDNIYAAGDCTSRIMLAHFAAYQGRIAANNIINPEKQTKCNYNLVPNCIFTYPEIATIGITEDEAAALSIKLKVNKFDFLGSGMARILNETEGFIKVISDSSNDKILGASIIGPYATELISCFSVFLNAGFKRNQIKDIIFAHPTISESIYEAV